MWVAVKLYIFFFLVLNTRTEFNYIILFLVLFVFVVVKLQGSTVKMPVKLYDSMPLLFLLVWLYGFIAGVLSGNDFGYVVRNFAGMVFYSFYYVLLWSNIQKNQLLLSLLRSAAFLVFFTIFLAILDFIGLDLSLIMVVVQMQVSETEIGHGRIYFTGQMAIFSLMTITLFSIIRKKRLRKNLQYSDLLSDVLIKLIRGKGSYFLLIAIVFSVMFVPASKGCILTGVVLFALTLLGGNENLSVLGVFKVLFFTVIGSGGFYFAISYFEYTELITMMFSDEQSSNILRFEQLTYLMNDLTLAGHGLGSVIPGYYRSSEFPYGFELIYINLFHKFGVFAVIIVLVYVFTFLRAFKTLVASNCIYASVSLGAMGYLFHALGNPVLFAPQTVLLHTIALFLLRSDKPVNRFCGNAYQRGFSIVHVNMAVQRD